MSKYLVQYKDGGEWIIFGMLAESIYDALDWVHDNIQQWNVSISVDEWPWPEEENVDLFA